MSIEILNESGVEVDEHALVRVARHALNDFGISTHAELSMLLVDVERMTQEHNRWMSEPGPTDVMAFPMDELDLRGARGAGAQREQARTAGDQPVVLGDILLCPEVAEGQAAAAGHSTAQELALLTTHGVLHLLGYDHAEPEEQAEMFGLQEDLLAAWKAAEGA